MALIPPCTSQLNLPNISFESTTLPANHFSIRLSFFDNKQLESDQVRNRFPRDQSTQGSHPISDGSRSSDKPNSLLIYGSQQRNQTTRLDPLGIKYTPAQLLQTQLIHGRDRLFTFSGRSEAQDVSSSVKAKRTPSGPWKKKTKAVHNPCHSRAPLAPFLSLPVMLLSSISRLSSGDSIKIFPKLRRPSRLPRKIVPKTPKQSGHLSSNFRQVVHKYRSECHKDDQEFLECFLKTDTDDMDGEDDHIKPAQLAQGKA
ncbi:hypothetical protein PCANC_08603 [Puccinia coronata f. sp. avenae]|uniref:Uncharacterized protein n=1 Tax=Puccinia coronata f. sp. avenae TaxID=200324 RepID=A0A2N5UY07_9BASI|nr:hypothetical protein PCANC_22770 [Puccinia coronata f. sp. avenae]PLW23056.1 hypothetical protein PCASD_11049 [Puccinia coronata f. sp. avenae]PLW42166.1 hypothetical protein PCASD_05605 [Puccinia coronata f. sp. avenae]PLW42536.1 hypothetical protein PCANC_08603 [Puccinia coronata f. sp. avenae]